MEWITSMFSFLGTSAGIIIICIVVILFIALAIMGKVNLKFGKNIITFGRQSKRSCGDCVLLIIGKRERLDAQKNFVLNRILKEQMNYAEQKLLDVQSLFLTSYREMLCKRRKQGDSSQEENKQYRLYQGILSSALMTVRDEIRRSFKENGLEHLGGVEFSNYVKNKVATLISLAKDYINNLYPYEGMYITIQDRMSNIVKLEPKLEDWCFDLFTKAKDIAVESKKKAEALDKEFSKEIDEFLQVK